MIERLFEDSQDDLITEATSPQFRTGIVNDEPFVEVRFAGSKWFRLVGVTTLVGFSEEWSKAEHEVFKFLFDVFGEDHGRLEG